jgi:hypothetical protein
MRAVRKIFNVIPLLMATASVGQTGHHRGGETLSNGNNPVPEKVQILPEAPSATQDKQDYLEPGVDPQNRLLVPFLKHIASDQKQFWSSPKHLDKTGGATFAGFLGFTGVLIGSDSWISKQVPDKPDQLNRSTNVSNYALYSLIGAGGSAYLLGKIRNDDHMSETGFLSGEAAINSTGISYLLKAITQRPRPLQDNGNGTFFQGGHSFPSEHSAVAWSIASVVAHEYPGPLTKFLAYGLASTVTLTRVTSKQHFASDAIVGSVLGWYIGRQIYRARHENELGGAPWGELQERKEKGPRNPDSMGSPYVPLDNWVYPAFDRLIAAGYVQSAFLGMRPWSRMQCARLLEEAGERLRYQGVEGGESEKIYQSLASEFGEEAARLEGAANIGVRLDSIYERTSGIAGTPLRDGFHFGQTIVNDYGRPYGEGVSVFAGASAHAVAGPFSFYVQGEYQRAPAGPALPDQARQAIQTVDGLPAPPPDAVIAPANRMKLLEGYVGIQLGGWQFSFGKQELWWGTGTGGSMLFSTNSEPVTMLQINSVKPFTLPGFFGRLGPLQIHYILGRLSGHNWVCCANSSDVGSWEQPLGDQPFITGQKISFKPSPNLELGVGATILMGGTGVPFTTHNFLQGVFSITSTGLPGSPSDPGDRRGEFNFAYRLPKLREWLTFYADAFTDDQVNPWFAWDKSALTAGLYFPKVPRIPKLDFRMEGVFTDLPGGGPVVQHGFFYINTRFKSGYTNDGNLMGSWIGRQGQGAEAWANYWFSPKNKLRLHFRHQKVSREFIPDGGTLTDLGVSGDFWVRSNLGLSASVQYERWLFPVIQPNVSRNVTAAVQVQFNPRKLFQHSGANVGGGRP